MLSRQSAHIRTTSVHKNVALYSSFLLKTRMLVFPKKYSSEAPDWI